LARSPVEASAPGKVILFGEHAVVYGRPAIAAPISQLRATARVAPAPSGSGLTIAAADLGARVRLAEAPADEPLACAARLALARLQAAEPDAVLSVHSAIPIASGLGSGAAVATALIRALTGYLGAPVALEALSALVYEVEKLHHGTPSGIDNTVIAYEQPVWFQRGHPIERLRVGAALTLVVADSGMPSATREAVGSVRQARARAPARYERLFDQVAEVVGLARQAIERGAAPTLGALMDRNHALLAEIGVSSEALDRLAQAARRAGALGAKLSGAGRGGHMIALAEDDARQAVAQALREAGAAHVIETTVA